MSYIVNLIDLIPPEFKKGTGNFMREKIVCPLSLKNHVTC